MIKPTFLTKSRYVNGLQCSKWIWLEFNRPEELPETDQVAQYRFNEGHSVGELAKSLFPEGIEISELNPIKNEVESRKLLKERKVLFEAGLIDKKGKCYARADILIPVEKDKWDIIEVKSATAVKEEYIEDVSFQKYCYESAGFKIRKCFILHVNNQYVRNGEIEPGEFFVIAVITEEVNKIMLDVPKKIGNLFKIISLKKCPEITIGDYCDDPFGVHKADKFWKKHPQCNIFELYNGGKKELSLFNSGILELKNIPEDFKLSYKQKIQKECDKSKKEYINKKEMRSFLKKIKYPLYFLDFESYNTAIPLYDNLKPYQQIPFQFSLHIIEKQGQKPKHYSFTAGGSEDPRTKFIEELKKVLGKKGSIIVYNQSFEQNILKNLGEYLPQHSKWIKSVIKRLADLYSPFRDFVYYHYKQKGSASIKNVLPVLTGETYKDFEIANGSQASLEYLFITHGSYEGEKATPEEIKKVRTNLEKYCGRDTEGMIWILEKLKKLIN